MPPVRASDPLIELSAITSIRQAAERAGVPVHEWLGTTPADRVLAAISSDGLHRVSPYAPDRLDRLASAMERYAVGIGDSIEDTLAVRPELVTYLHLHPAGQLQVALASQREPEVAADLCPWGGSISKPRNATWTTTWMWSVGSLWTQEQAVFDWVPPEDTGLLLLDGAGDARAFVVDSADDWVRLCNEFPDDASGRFRDDGHCLEMPSPVVQPDWPRVGEAYDAVHLTWHGLLDAGLRQLPCRDGHTILNGWNTETTLWLRLPDVRWSEVDEHLGAALDRQLATVAA